MKTILILSTDREVSEYLKEKLSCQDFNIKTVNDPDNIFRSIEKHKPDLLLIDFILQDGNGGSICHQIKCNPDTRNLPVIILTEHASSFAFFKKFGCNGVIEKPFNVPTLLSKVSGCLRAEAKTRIPKANHSHLDAGRRATSMHQR